MAVVAATPTVSCMFGDRLVAGFLVTPHAAWEMERRGLELRSVEEVLRAPEQRVSVGPGRVVFQSRLSLGRPAKTYLVRVVIETERDPPEIVTAYKTSKIRKYWRPQP